MKRTLSIESVASVINDILKEKPGLIKAIGVFGSLARGDFNDNSDIDLLVEYNEPPVFSMELFNKYCSLCNTVQDTLSRYYNRSVDIAHFENGSLENLDDPNVINEVVWL